MASTTAAAAAALAVGPAWEASCRDVSSQLLLASLDGSAIELGCAAMAHSSLAVTSGIDALQTAQHTTLRTAMAELASVRTICATLAYHAVSSSRRRCGAALRAVDDATPAPAVEGVHTQEDSLETDVVDVSDADDAAMDSEGSPVDDDDAADGESGAAVEQPSSSTSADAEEKLKLLLAETAAVIQELTEQNVGLRSQLELLAAETVPVVMLLAAEARVQQLEQENKTAAHQLSFLLYDGGGAVSATAAGRSPTPPPAPSVPALDEVAPAEDDDAEDDGAPLPWSLRHRGLWRDTLRDIDEKVSISLLSLEEKEMFKRQTVALAEHQAVKAGLDAKLTEMETLNREVCRDCETLAYDNSVLAQNLAKCLVEQASQQQQLADLRGMLDHALAATASTTPFANKYLRGSERIFMLAENNLAEQQQQPHPSSSSSLLFKTPLSSDSTARQRPTGSNGGGDFPLPLQAHQMPRNSLLGGRQPFLPLPGLARLQTFANAENLLCGTNRAPILPATQHLTGVPRATSTRLDKDPVAEELLAPLSFANVMDLLKRNRELTQELYRLVNFPTTSGGEAPPRAVPADVETLRASQQPSKRSRTESQLSAGPALSSSQVLHRDVGMMTDATITLAQHFAQAPVSSALPAVALPPRLQELKEVSVCAQLSSHCLSLLQSQCDLLLAGTASATATTSAADIANDALLESLRNAVQLAATQEMELCEGRETIAVLTARLDGYSRDLALCRNDTLCDAVGTAAAVIASSLQSNALAAKASGLLQAAAASSRGSASAALLPSAADAGGPSPPEWMHLNCILTHVMHSQHLLAEALRRSTETRAAHAAAATTSAQEAEDEDYNENSGGGGGGDGERAPPARRRAIHKRDTDELQRLLAREQEKTRAATDLLHKERVAHRNLMEKVWQLEVSTAEAEAFAERARVDMAGMLSVAQYEKQVQDLQAATDLAADLQNTVADLQQRELALQQQLAQAGEAYYNVQAEHLRVYDSQEAEKKHLAQLIHRHSITQTDLESQLVAERHALQTMQRAAEDLRRGLVGKDREIADAKQEAKKSRALLIEQQVGQQADVLRGLFPSAESTVDELLGLVTDLARQRDGLTQDVSTTQLATRTMEQQLKSAQADLRAAQQERQQAVLAAQGLSEREAQLLDAHALQCDSLQARLGLAEREMLILQADKAAAAEREEAMRVRIEALANDPISANVRKYGIPRTKLLQDQIDLMHARTVELAASLDASTGSIAALRRDVQTLEGQLTAAQQREAAVQAARTAVMREKELLGAQKTTAEQAVTAQAQQLQQQSDRIADTTARLTSSTAQVAALEGTLRDREQALQTADAQLRTLGEDNVKLLDQVTTLLKDMEDLEAQKRAQDAHLRRRFAAAGGGGGGAPAAAAVASSGRHAGGGAGGQRRVSPTAPRSLTRDQLNQV